MADVARLSPREAHAALLAELRRRLAVCEAQTVHLARSSPGDGYSYEHTPAYGIPHYLYPSHADIDAWSAQRTERPAELRELIRIAEIHGPSNLDREPSHAHLTMCSVCYTENRNWPCRTIAGLLAMCGIEVRQ